MTARWNVVNGHGEAVACYKHDGAFDIRKELRQNGGCAPVVGLGRGYHCKSRTGRSVSRRHRTQCAIERAVTLPRISSQQIFNRPIIVQPADVQGCSVQRRAHRRRFELLRNRELLGVIRLRSAWVVRPYSKIEPYRQQAGNNHGAGDDAACEAKARNLPRGGDAERDQHHYGRRGH